MISPGSGQFDPNSAYNLQVPQEVKPAEINQGAPSMPEENQKKTYLDSNRLLSGPMGSEMIAPQHRDWHLQQALILDHAKSAEPGIKAKLELAALHGYSKAATIQGTDSSQLGIQTTPLFDEDGRYHRSTRNAILDSVREICATEVGANVHEVSVIESMLFREVLARELPQPHLEPGALSIDSLAKFEALVDKLIDNTLNGKQPINRVLIDISDLIQGKSCPEIRKIAQDLELAFINKLKERLEEHGEVEQRLVGKELLSKVHLIGFAEKEGVSLLFTPEFLLDPKEEYEAIGNVFISGSEVGSKHGMLDRLLEDMKVRTGYRLSPDTAKATMLQFREIDSILAESNVARVELATHGKLIPKVLNSSQDLESRQIVHQFAALSDNPRAPPYLQVLPKATMNLVVGLMNVQGLDAFFERNGLTDVLQIFHFRVMSAMNEAIHQRLNPVLFHNQIEIIHQEIQNILSIVEPYGPDALAESVKGRLSNFVPADLDTHVHAKASAMRTLSSIVASVEEQKGSNALHVAVLKDSYYESTDTLESAKTHTYSVLDGDTFNKEGITKAFDSKAGPVDLFVCEFHHNISTTLQVYSVERIADQIKAMHREGMLAERCTVAIDTTIGLEQSEELRQLLNDPEIHQLIKDGKLNIVSFRSAQKFDMLGMDNYYGGIALSVNNNSAFQQFNERMDDPNDQLKGLSYQGLCHFESVAGGDIERYRQGIMKNTQRLYDQIVTPATYREGTTNPLQISRIEDESCVFLDIKFPNLPGCSNAFLTALRNFVADNNIPMTRRASFGFANTNLSRINNEKIRLNPGLEGERAISHYAFFINSVQITIERFQKEAEGLTPKQFDDALASAIVAMRLKV